MSKTTRLREEVRILLEERGSANTVEIFDKIGHVRGQFRGSTYTVCVWGLRIGEATAHA